MVRKRVVKGPDERRREIVDAARELFVTVGYTETAVSDIVRQLGVAQGTFYWYFSSKEEVLQAIMRESAEQWLGVISGVVARTDMNAVDKLCTMEAELVRLAVESPELVHTFHLRANSAIHDRITDEMLAQCHPLITQTVRQGIGEGLFQVRSPEVASFFILAVANGFFDRLTREISTSDPGQDGFPWPPSGEWQEMHEAMWEFLLRGLGATVGSGAQQ